MIYLVIYKIIIHSNLYQSGSRLLQCNVDYATSYINTYRSGKDCICLFQMLHKSTKYTPEVVLNCTSLRNKVICNLLITTWSYYKTKAHDLINAGLTISSILSCQFSVFCGYKVLSFTLVFLCLCLLTILYWIFFIIVNICNYYYCYNYRYCIKITFIITLFIINTKIIIKFLLILL